jgi:tRNA nucleotidyltransferase (CCA-adding enzyme)
LSSQPSRRSDPAGQESSPSGRPELIDAFGGLQDLAARQIRVIHANSFIEDPTRIYRAVRFAVRLNFELAPQTAAFIQTALQSGIYAQVQAKYAKLPALQVRLIQELRQSLEADYWEAVLRKLASLGALCCIHPDLQLSADTFTALQQAISLQASQPSVKRWLIMLEVLLLSLDVEGRVSVAEKFQLPTESIRRLQTFEQDQAVILAALPTCERPSQVVKLLKAYDASTLILVAARLPNTPIPQYLTNWSQVKSPLDGGDLLAMGYKPGRQFKRILEVLLNAALDGEVGDQATARKLVAERFPLNQAGRDAD